MASYLVDFSIRKEDKERYRKIGNIYQDSLISLCVPGSRRAKLNYLRQRTGKAAKVKELVR